MKFPEKQLRLVSLRTYEKEGKKINFVKLADTTTFDTVEMILSRDCDVSLVEAGKDFYATLEIDGKYSSVSLSAIAGKKF